MMRLTRRMAGAVALLGIGALSPPTAAAPPGPVVDHTTLPAFDDLSDTEIAAAAALRVLFIDHSVGENINQGLNCYASASVAASPSFCRRFDHVDPALSARPEWFAFDARYDRGNWRYHAGGPSYWREWPAFVEGLLREQPDWDVIIMMPSYLVAPNGGWQPFEALEAAHPDATFVYATSSLPRGTADGQARELVMQQFNADARAYALAHGKPFLDVADLLAHDYAGRACFDTRDGKAYCRTPDDCENLPDDGLEIPAICQHYTSEFYGGHLGNVSGGMLRMAQSMWLLMARLAGAAPVPATPTGVAPVLSPTPTTPSVPTATVPAGTSSPSPAPTVAETPTRPVPSEPPPTPAAPATSTDAPAQRLRLYVPHAQAH